MHARGRALLLLLLLGGGALATTILAALSWIYLSAHITLLAAEGNVVATRRLWPRSFSLMIEQPATQADKRRPHAARQGRRTPPG